MTTVQIRQNFLNYFRECYLKHKFAPPSNVFINDPTLLFVNAGMNQFKNIFLGEQDIKPGYERLMNSQICIRAGGKHNDLDDVGKDSYHLTSFEMLGNWSLNNYWKEDAIKLAFEFLTVCCKLSVDNMYVTYFEGNDDIAPDEETKEIWKKYLAEDRIIRGNFKDNFWMMGETGPCGSCTEIHYDMIGNRFVPELVNQDDPNVIEIWNNVFMEFNKTNAGYIKLASRFVDTGMGLERLAMVLQGKRTLYQIDAFRYIIGYAQALTCANYFTDNYNNNVDTAYRIFADHMRTVVICLFQGIKFDANKQGFVVRKIYRRMLTYMYVYLLGHVSCKMNSLLIQNLIKEILAYYLFFTVDINVINDIWQKMILEEELFASKVGSLVAKYNKIIKKKSRDDTIKELKNSYGYDLEIINLFIN